MDRHTDVVERPHREELLPLPVVDWKSTDTCSGASHFGMRMTCGL